MKTPAVELLGYMVMEMENDAVKTELEQHKTWIYYLMLQYSKPSFGEEDSKTLQSRKKFEEAIRPKKSTESAPNKKQDWDFTMLDQLNGQQEGG